MSTPSVKRSVRVIKVGGRAQSHPQLASVLTALWAEAPGSVVVVHGGGDEVSALQRAFGVEPVFVGGRRVTAASDVDHLRMALSGSANKRLVAALVMAGARAVGLSGEDAGLLGATVTDQAMGRVGSPTVVNADFLEFILGGGYLPVVSPVSRDLDGDSPATAALNVNGDDAAAALAVAVDAQELVLVSDVEGVMAKGALLPWIAPEDVAALVADGTAAGGMAAKLDAAVAALDGGVPRVRIGNLAAIADLDRGTVVSRAHPPAWSS
ncbi:MAG: acetylglutamate kinase [Gemmatimonadaceae bacterium]|nr:acetylglutamate kinase [Gemmatimonadaceae bacterium]